MSKTEMFALKQAGAAIASAADQKRTEHSLGSPDDSDTDYEDDGDDNCNSDVGSDSGHLDSLSDGEMDDVTCQHTPATNIGKNTHTHNSAPFDAVIDTKSGKTLPFERLGSEADDESRHVLEASAERLSKAKSKSNPKGGDLDAAQDLLDSFDDGTANALPPSSSSPTAPHAAAEAAEMATTRFAGRFWNAARLVRNALRWKMPSRSLSSPPSATDADEQNMHVKGRSSPGNDPLATAARWKRAGTKVTAIVRMSQLLRCGGRRGR